MRPGKKTRPRGGDNSYWTSYSDMMAGMLFVFALILFAAVYQLVDLQQKKTIELQTKEAQLSTQQSLLIDQEAELKDKEELLAATTLALQQQQEELDQNRTALTSAQDSLALQQSKIEEQAALLAAQQAQIDKLVGLRSQIIEDLRDNLSDVGQRVTVDRKTGAVTFESSVLFDTGRNEIKEAGKAALNSCIPVYIHTLLSEEYRDYVGEIIVEGHTDTTGQYLNNLALFAAARAGCGDLLPERRDGWPELYGQGDVQIHYDGERPRGRGPDLQCGRHGEHGRLAPRGD